MIGYILSAILAIALGATLWRMRRLAVVMTRLRGTFAALQADVRGRE